MNRVKVVKCIVASLFLILIISLFNLEIIKGYKFRELGNKNCIRLLPQAGCRGKIFDRDGNVVVDNKLSYDVMILPQGDNDIEQALEKSSWILGFKPKEIRNIFNSSYISPPLPVIIAKNIDIKKAIALEEIKLDIPNIIIQPNPQRFYPYDKLASHVIGYVNEIDRWRLTKLADYGYKTKDIVGFGGVEEKYDYYLRQEEGGLSIEVDHRGKFVRLLGFRPARNGKNIELTLSLKIQKIVEEKLGGKKGCVIVMNPYNGEVLAMASSPNFDPGIFVNKSSNSLANIFKDADAPLLNRAISGVYPAGSIFKLVVATAALEMRKINLNTTFLCIGSTLVGRQEFSCWSTHGQQGLIKAIAHSCNVFFYKTGLLVGAQAIHDYAMKFGFSHTCGFELPYEAAGFVPSPLLRKINKFRNWYDGDTVNLAIGQGEVLVTPLQVTRMMAVFANQGYLVTPYIVKAIDGRDISLSQRKITALDIRKNTIDYIRKGLREVVSDPNGTANILSGLSVPIAGKTGTAQTPPRTAHAWFAGFFPFEKPKFVICVFLEHAGPGYYSCLLGREIIEAMLNEGLI